MDNRIGARRRIRRVRWSLALGAASGLVVATCPVVAGSAPSSAFGVEARDGVRATGGLAISQPTGNGPIGIQQAGAALSERTRTVPLIEPSASAATTTPGARSSLESRSGVTGARASIGPTFADPLVPAAGVLLGAWVAPSGGWRFEDVVRSTRAFETDAGRKLDIVHQYEGWSETFPDAMTNWIVDNARTPMISWALADTARIISGVDDPMIRSRAKALATLGVPVLLRWGYEMDGGGAAGMVGSPARYIAAWRHIHRLFETEGASNVRFVWCPNAWAIRMGYGQQFYPGNDVVDWIGGDGYNWAPARPGAPWESFTSVFQAWYDWAAPTGKPLIVGEFGVMERSPGEKAAWWSGVPDGLRHLPAIKAVTYFDEDKFDSDGRHNWLVDTTPGSREAFRIMVADPVFGRLTALGPPPDRPAHFRVEAPEWPAYQSVGNRQPRARR